MQVEIGQEAPAFTLFNTEKNKVSLSDYRGKNVILVFFPFAFSGVCTKEVCTLRDGISAYAGMNAEVVGVSVDSLFTLGKFKQEHNLPFELLSDFNKEVSDLFGCLSETFAFEYRGVSRRSSFVIDREGVVRFAEILESPGDLPDFDAIESCLKSL